MRDLPSNDFMETLQACASDPAARKGLLESRSKFAQERKKTLLAGEVEFLETIPARELERLVRQRLHRPNRAPNGLEVLLKKAAADERFLAEILTKRSAFFEKDSGNVLDEFEKQILDSASEDQFRMLVGKIQLDGDQRDVFARLSFPALQIYLALTSRNSLLDDRLYVRSRGMQPDVPKRESAEQLIKMVERNLSLEKPGLFFQGILALLALLLVALVYFWR